MQKPISRSRRTMPRGVRLTPRTSRLRVKPGSAEGKRASGSRADVSTPAAKSKATRTLRLLIVEDHPVLAAGLRFLFSAEPDLTVVEVVGTVREAAALPTDTEIDVLIADFRLPDGNGAEAAAAIRRSRPRLPVLFLSAVESPAALMAAIQAGAKGYVLKSQAAETLAGAVRRVAAGEMLISTAVLVQLINEKGEQTHVVDTLTGREREIMRLMSRGLNNHELADQLEIEYGTVRSHVRNILAKLEVHTRLQAIVRATELGLLDPDQSPLRNSVVSEAQQVRSTSEAGVGSGATRTYFERQTRRAVSHI